ncbi:MAG: hypothetical protein CL583_06280 [Alteromonadaceae bacterium]|nr:hypothetical protein [Alteromonadaceae bacterium]
MQCSRFLAVPALIMALTGCSSVSLQNPVEAELQQPLYADLQQSESGWNFTALSTDVTSFGGVPVNLATGEPIMDRENYDCSTWMWSAYHSDDIIKPCAKGTFRGAKMTNGTVPYYVVSGVFTMGISMVLGVAPMESGVLWDEYNAALAEAYGNSGLSASSLAGISGKFAAMENLREESESACARIPQLRDAHLEAYEGKYLPDLASHIRIQDRSGFLDRYGDVNPANWVSGTVQLPHHSEFMAGCAYTDVKPNVPADTGQANAILDQLLAKEEQRLLTLRENEQRYDRLLAAGGELEIRCRPEGRDNGMVYSSSCTQIVKFHQDGYFSKPDLPFTITGRDFNNVMPSAYKAEDENVEIELSGTLVKVHNRTGKYISVDAVTLYYENVALTNSKSGSTLYELAPGTYQSFHLSSFRLNDLPNDFAGMTVGQVNARTIDFALSAKYRVTEIDYPRTLHRKQTYKLASLL